MSGTATPAVRLVAAGLLHAAMLVGLVLAAALSDPLTAALFGLLAVGSGLGVGSAGWAALRNG